VGISPFDGEIFLLVYLSLVKILREKRIKRSKSFQLDYRPV